MHRLIKKLLNFTLIVFTIVLITSCDTINTTRESSTTSSTNRTNTTNTTITTSSTLGTTAPSSTQTPIGDKAVVIHYQRTNRDYHDWNLWVWKASPTSGEGVAYYFEHQDEFGAIVRIDLSDELNDATVLGIIPRLGEWLEKDVNQDRFIDLNRLTNGELHVYLVQGDSTIYYSKDDIGKNTDSLLDLELNFTDTDHHGVYYEIFVRSFADSNGDGIGDFRGVANNLPYLSDLGVEGIWLMPMLESNSYHGYDVIDYYNVEKDYGSMADFEFLLAEAKRHGIKVIIDLVINHTSAQHPWFKSSKSSTTSPYRDWYVWIDSNDPLRTRDGAWGQNIWHYSSGKYYAGYFWDQMPDLNMENEAVRQELKSIGEYWLAKGVDGYRLDAAMHMYGVNEYPDYINNRSENVLWWHEFRTKLQTTYPDVYLVGEVWESPSVIAPYYKGLHSNFNFDFSHKILNVVKSNSASGYTSGLENVYNLYEQYNPNYIDAPFLTNHDEDRIATQVNNLEDLKLAADLLFMLSGNPYIYYGEEIGMKGYKSNGPYYDETRRLPFIWSNNFNPNNTTWFYSDINNDVASVEEQLLDPNSLLNHYKRLIELRKSNIALVEGEFIPYSLDSNLISYLKSTDTQTLLIIHNPNTYDIAYNVNQNTIVQVIYQSNMSNNVSLIKANSTIVLEVNN